MQKRHNIIGFGVCGPGEADRYLTSTLDNFKRLCDETVIVCNACGEKERELIHSYGFHLWDDTREWGKFQWRIKEDAVRGLAQFTPDWILTLDMDETIEAERADIEQLCNKGGLGYFFYIINLYDEGYAKEWCFWNNRLFKYEEPLTFAAKALHCGLSPELHWRYSNYAPFMVKHYGLMKKEDRDRKAERYKKYDPSARWTGKAYYDFLTSKAPVTPFDPHAVQTELEEVNTYHFKSKPTRIMEKEQKFYYVKNPAGKILDIPDYQLDETLKRDGFELISKEPIVLKGGSVKSTMVEVELPKDDVDPKTCHICGFKAKSKAGFTAHMCKHK